MHLNKREIGTAYENRAVEYLSGLGFEILEQNFRCRQGEIDIIAKENEYIVFVEVKYRISSKYGEPLEAVNWKKQKVITRVARYYLYTHGKSEWTPCRFDIVSINGENIQLLRNAFEAYKL